MAKDKLFRYPDHASSCASDMPVRCVSPRIHLCSSLSSAPNLFSHGISFPTDLAFLAGMPIRIPLGHELLRIDLEEIHGLLRMVTSDVDERRRGDVICLAFAHERVVFKDIFAFGFVVMALGVEDAFGFGSDTGGGLVRLCC